MEDFFIIGTDTVIDEVIESLKAYGTGLKVKNKLTDYLSCKIFQYINQGKAGSYKLIQFDIRGKVLEKISKTWSTIASQEVQDSIMTKNLLMSGHNKPWQITVLHGVLEKKCI